MPDTPPEIVTLLQRLGIGQGLITSVRFGGVVGKITLVTIVSIASLSTVALRASTDNLLWGCVIAIVVIAISSLAGVLYHGNRHPLEATLEGGQVVAFQHAKNAFAMKDLPTIPSPDHLITGQPIKQIDAKNAEMQIEGS
jgi:hypothetical protein